MEKGHNGYYSKINDETFSLNLETVLALHALCGKEETLEWGVIRKHQVGVNCQYLPPSPEGLTALIEAGLTELQNIADPAERAVNTFAFISKAQPFYDANKRMALLLMNGVLLSAGLYPLFVPAIKKEVFVNSLHILYETGRSNELLQFFENTVEQFYPENGGYGMRRKNLLSVGIHIHEKKKRMPR